MTGVLDGLRVIDFGQYIAGPLAAMLLADQGADVIRIDPPGGPRWDMPANAIWNRGKRAISLDLKNPDDLAVARALIASADVVIENFRPGVMTRLGLDAEKLCQDHPGLIWCALPGFAAADPRAAMPAWEGVLGAATGYYLLKVQAERDDAGRSLPKVDEDRPIYSAIPVSSMFAACTGAMSIAMALIARQRDGRGQRIEAPLFDATFTAIGMPHWVGKPGTPWTRSYECADGRFVDLICFHEKFVRAFVHEADVDHWLDAPFAGDIRKPFLTTPEQATALLEEMEALFRTRTALEWESSLNAAGVPVAMCRTTTEWCALPAARQAGAVIERDDPRFGRTVQPGLLVTLGNTPGAPGRRAPLPDQHRAEILAELAALPPREPRALPPEDNRPPLAGLKVVDLGTVLVGPTCGRTLAEFGAKVVKIENPFGQRPDPDLNRGKRSMVADLTNPAGLDMLLRLSDQADIFIQNFRFGVAEGLGFGDAALRARNPALIYMSLNLYGRNGPWAARPGFENQAQAASGIQERFGGGYGPAKEALPINDYGTALLGTFGIALALYERGKGGAASGQHVEAALTFSATMMQSAMLIASPDGQVRQPRGQKALGTSALHRAYQAVDGWLFLGARDGDWQALDQIAGLGGIASHPPGRRAIALEQAFAQATVAE
ncbi:crotonobetainyl-CoA:carnitine CoA-transferase CaiB-like acyl-CoA transferase [Sphingobium sp. JAI105]|nr:crotonobetainyl-CoA:carnitine CoA-transferase CaiB-like acyl-CoA transferase [Sphingobium sp. JAI105]